MSLGALSPEAHETLAIAMNRIGAKAVSGEGGEASEPLSPLCQRRQRQQNDQADRERPFRRHRRISRRVRRSRDQGRAGRQARRRRPASGLQGHRVHRQAAPCDAGRDLDLPAAAPRHLFDRGSGAAHLRPEADQPERAGLREAGQLGRASARSRRASPRRMPTSSWSPAMSAAPAPAPQTSGQIRRHTVGNGPSPKSIRSLTLNGLRGRIRLRTDGGLKTGRDIVIAAILGAEEYRHRHAFAGRDGLHHEVHGFSPEKVINLMTFIAEEVREILAKLGCRRPRRGDRPHRTAASGEPRRRASRRPRPQPDPRQGRRPRRSAPLQPRHLPQPGARQPRRTDNR
ncbi:Glutamate synthase, large subunit [Aphelenchoides bicaudatus]|nr:Glutamate synthase, large subunit [Aphelenchoides bicaudatus]